MGPGSPCLGCPAAGSYCTRSGVDSSLQVDLTTDSTGKKGGGFRGRGGLGEGSRPRSRCQWRGRWSYHDCWKACRLRSRPVVARTGMRVPPHLDLPPSVYLEAGGGRGTSPVPSLLYRNIIYRLPCTPTVLGLSSHFPLRRSDGEQCPCLGTPSLAQG